MICWGSRRDISALCDGVRDEVDEDEAADDFVSCAGGWGEALEGLIADTEGGATFGIHFYEASAGFGVGGHRRRNWNFVDGFVGTNGETLKGEVEELGVGCELGWNCGRS